MKNQGVFCKKIAKMLVFIIIIQYNNNHSNNGITERDYSFNLNKQRSYKMNDLIDLLQFAIIIVAFTAGVYFGSK